VANDYGGGVKGADIVGVDLTYTYAFTTPLGAMLKWAGASTFPMTDETVMDINP
jgi:opacity protein-like surface antigen